MMQPAVPEIVQFPTTRERGSLDEQNDNTPLVAFTAVLLLAPLATIHAADAPSRPNVLFILCDDIRWNAMSCAGHPTLKTPNIDRIANEGVRFANMFCTTSLCSPSRASILTGLYAHTHGVTNNFTELPTTRTHWAQRLREEGYTTAYLGKWHMGEDNDAPRPGFDFFATHKGQGKYFDTEWNVNGNRVGVIKGYYTTIVTDMALDWLKRDHGGKPWALSHRPQGAAQLLCPGGTIRAQLRQRAASPIPTPPFTSTTSRHGSSSGSTPGTASTARCSAGGRTSRTTGPRR